MTEKVEVLESIRNCEIRFYLKLALCVKLVFKIHSHSELLHWKRKGKHEYSIGSMKFHLLFMNWMKFIGRTIWNGKQRVCKEISYMPQLFYCNPFIVGIELQQDIGRIRNSVVSFQKMLSNVKTDPASKYCVCQYSCLYS